MVERVRVSFFLGVSWQPGVIEYDPKWQGCVCLERGVIPSLRGGLDWDPGELAPRPPESARFFVRGGRLEKQQMFGDWSRRRVAADQRTLSGRSTDGQRTVNGRSRADLGCMVACSKGR